MTDSTAFCPLPKRMQISVSLQTRAGEQCKGFSSRKLCTLLSQYLTEKNPSLSFSSVSLLQGLFQFSLVALSVSLCHKQKCHQINIHQWSSYPPCFFNSEFSEMLLLWPYGCTSMCPAPLVVVVCCVWFFVCFFFFNSAPSLIKRYWLFLEWQVFCSLACR